MQYQRIDGVILGLVMAFALLPTMSHADAAPVDGTPAPSATAVVSSEPNATCPVTVGEKIDPNQWVDYQGKRVYLCCARCKRKFEQDSLAYLANLPAFFTAGMDATAPKIPISSATGASSAQHDAEHDVQPDTRPQAHAHAHDDAQATDEHDSHDDAHEADHASIEGVSAEHDHAEHTHGSSRSFWSRLISWLGNFHPPMTDFPVALMMAALVAEVMFVATRRPMFDAAGHFTVWFAIVGTVAAVILGWCFGGFKLTDGDWIMTTHRWVGTAAGLWAFLLAYVASKAWTITPGNYNTTWRLRYRIVLVVAVLLISINGFLGGALMYGLDHYNF